MNNLDKRLREALNKQFVYIKRTKSDFSFRVESSSKTVDAIKQVFYDEGYIPKSELPTIHNELGLMTGQEWYERFEADMESGDQEGWFYNSPVYKLALETAKKASNL